MFSRVLDWHGPEKSLLLVFLLIPVYLQAIAWSHYVLAREDRDTYVNVAYLEHFMRAGWGIVILSVVVILARPWVRRQARLHLPFEHFAIHFFTWSMMVLAYSFGTLSYPVGIILIGAPLFGFILLNRRAVWIATSLCIAFLVAVSYAATLGLVDYAPMLKETPATTDSLFWTNTVFFFALPFLIVNIVVIDHLLTSWRAREEHVKTLATTDALTGVLNRGEILDVFERAGRRQRQVDRPTALILLDLDHFKRVNDTYGHPAGDAVLVAASAALRRNLRDGDFLGRYGGEEFLIVLPGADLEQARQIAERCRLALMQAPVPVSADHVIPVSASFGVLSIARFSDALVAGYIQMADQALYQAKSAGRNRVMVVCH